MASDIPADPHDALLDAGAASLREAIPILTKAQALKLFRSAYMAACDAEVRARRVRDEWLDDWSAREARKAEEAAREAEKAARGARQQRPDPSPTFRAEPVQPHRILGVTANAERSEVQAAWRTLATRWHPDKPGGDATQMAAINAARDQMLSTVRA